MTIAGDRTQLHKDANRLLDQHLAPDEPVKVVIRGPSNSAMIGTDRRVFVFKKGFFVGRDVSIFDYEDISGVTIKTGFQQGHVALQGPGLQTTGIGHGGNETHPKTVRHAIEINDQFTHPKQQQEARERVTLLQRAIDEFHAARRQPVASAPAAATPDIPEQIRKLGELRDAGILTPEEFEAKKTELLARL